MVKVKQMTDVHIIVSIHQLTSGAVTPLVAIATKNTDATTKATVYNSLYDLTNDYGEDTGVYAQAEAMFEADNFKGPVEVIAYPNTDAADPSSVQASGTADGGTVTASATPGIVTGLAEHLYDGFIYLVLDNASEDQIEAVSDFLYDNQRIMLVTQPSSVADLQKLQTHVLGYQKTKDLLCNTAALVVTTAGNYRAAQAAAYAAANLPVDWQHIGNQTTFAPDADLAMADYDAIAAAGGTTVVNKAGDYMLLNGKALTTNYIDQFVHTQLVVDRFQNALQKYLNRHKFVTYDDTHIKEMTQTLQTTGDDLSALGVLFPLSDGNSVDITSVSRSNTPNSDVANRSYNGFAIKAQIADDIDTVNMKLDITL